MVGQHLVLVAELDRGERHLLDRRAAVGPVRVRVQVAAEPAAQLVAALGERAAVLLLEAGQPLRQLAAGRGGDHLGAAGAHAGELGERALLDRARTSSSDSGRIAAAAPRKALTL